MPKEGYFVQRERPLGAREGEQARVGISDYLQQQLTDIYYFDPPTLGTVVEQFGELGAVESTKAVFEIVAPVSGTVVAVNEEVVRHPDLINEDPYGAGGS